MVMESYSIKIHKIFLKIKKTYTVNHNYGDSATSADQNLSLLVHDDGMVYNFKPTTVTGGAQDQECNSPTIADAPV